MNWERCLAYNGSIIQSLRVWTMHFNVQKSTITAYITKQVLTSDDKSSEVGDAGSSLWLGDAAVQVLVLTGHFSQPERGRKLPVVDVFRLHHWNVVSITPLYETTREMKHFIFACLTDGIQSWSMFCAGRAFRENEICWIDILWSVLFRYRRQKICEWATFEWALWLNEVCVCRHY